MQSKELKRQRKFTAIIVGYPFALIAIAMALNGLWFGIEPLVPSLPAGRVLLALVVSAGLLLANHTWLMTSTELTRLRHKTFATPEEWAASGTRPSDMPDIARAEVDRRHNAHRNATENTVFFAILAGIMAIVSPSAIAAQIWLIGFGVARLGYSFAYLRGKDDLRGIFMSASLICLYGMAGYLLIGAML